MTAETPVALMTPTKRAAPLARVGPNTPATPVTLTARVGPMARATPEIQVEPKTRVLGLNNYIPLAPLSP